jgi:phytoene synthase
MHMAPSLARSYCYCERLARRQAANFYPAFRVLPKPQRRAMCALYAFMRVTDDLADETGQIADKQAALSTWRKQLDLALTAEYAHPLHAALHETVQTYRIPSDYLHAVIDGVEMDLLPVTYSTFTDLYRYCYRVASAVGLACIHIWGFRDERARVYAEAAGIAFQLTNILRDLREDAARGRVYLPQEELMRFGYPREQLLCGELNQYFRDLMRFQVGRARQYYRAARPLAELLSPAGRAVFQVMRRTYEGLLDAIERRNYDVFSSRVSLSRLRKLGLLMQAIPVRFGWVKENGG